MMLDFQRENVRRVTRRQLFGSAASGIGIAALCSLLNSSVVQGHSRSAKKRGDYPSYPIYHREQKGSLFCGRAGGRLMSICLMTNRLSENWPEKIFPIRFVEPRAFPPCRPDMANGLVCRRSNHIDRMVSAEQP